MNSAMAELSLTSSHGHANLHYLSAPMLSHQDQDLEANGSRRFAAMLLILFQANHKRQAQP